MAGKFFILETGCVDWAGHRCNGVKYLNDYLTNRGFSVACAVHKNVSENVCQVTSALPVFRHAPWPPLFKGSEEAELKNFSVMAHAIADDCNTLLANADLDDIILIPTASEREIYGLYLWARKRPVDTIPYILPTIPLADFVDLDTGAYRYPTSEMLKSAVHDLVALVPKPRLVFSTVTRTLQTLLSNLLSVSVELASTPNCLDGFAPSAGKIDGGRELSIVCAPGHLKGAKGPETVVRLTEAFLGAPVEFHVQNWPTPSHLPSNTILHGQGLSPDAYRQLIRTSDILVLPYAGSFYRYGMSAVFEEAVAAGCICVVPSGTWMAEQIADGHAAGIVTNDAGFDAMRDALSRVLSHRDMYLARAGQLAEPWRARAGINAYMIMVAHATGLAIY